jgi:hypothetical protein
MPAGALWCTFGCKVSEGIAYDRTWPLRVKALLLPEIKRAMEQVKNSTIMDWLFFLVSTVITVALLVVAPEWFWVPLPFVLTFLVRALRAM